jgi:hypothetical protein
LANPIGLGQMAEPSMSNTEHFEIDDDFLSEHEGTADFDRSMLDRVDRRAKQAGNLKRGKAAWSKLEDVLAERRLEKELNEFYDD